MTCTLNSGLNRLVFDVFFAGFESDTIRMQKNGWQLSQEALPARASFRVAFKHEGAGLYMISNEIDMRTIYEVSRRGEAWKSPIPIQIQCVFNQGRLQIMPVMGITSASMWQACDAFPSADEQSVKEVPFHEWVPFKPINSDAPEIVVPKHTVPELMELILKRQDPKQKEIREKARKERWIDENLRENLDYNPGNEIKAQIISIAG